MQIQEEGEVQSNNDNEELFEHLRLVVDKGQAPLRIDKFLTIKTQNASRNRIQNAITAESLIVNGKPVKSNYKVKPLDEISLVLPTPPRDTELLPQNIPLNIIYEDDNLLIVNKPAGLVVHPGFNNYDGTLVNGLLYHFENLPTANGSRRPGLVHRIDKNTSGLLLVAKDEVTMTHLARQFYEHTTEREYLALVWGNIEEESGTINAHLYRSPIDRRITQVTQDETLGKSAITHYTVLERFTYTTLISCKLETGRTHQIRAHMKHIKHPIFSDMTYGGNEIHAGPKFNKYKQFIQNCLFICPRQALHAKSIGFTHPMTKERMYFTADLPLDMESVINKWRVTSHNFKWADEE